jgi:hypothetical protein
MGNVIDTTFDVYSDTPKGRDPDKHSATLRRYHKELWSKPLPDGTPFSLSDRRPGDYLLHNSPRGEFCLSSDSIGHTYRHVKAMARIVNLVPEDELNRFFSVCSTVGAYTVFPARMIDGKITINAARGFNSRIRDRFDLTLECIRLHYLGQESPLSAVMARYANFFDLFGCFRGYVDFFLLQDLVSMDGTSINFLVPFNGFEGFSLPSDVNGYRSYRDKMVAFVTARNRRIAEQSGGVGPPI